MVQQSLTYSKSADYELSFGAEICELTGPTRKTGVKKAYLPSLPAFVGLRGLKLYVPCRNANDRTQQREGILSRVISENFGVYGERLAPTEYGLDLLQRQLPYMLSKLRKTEPVSYETLKASRKWSPDKVKRYDKAYEKLCEIGELRYKDSFTSFFTKDENAPFSLDSGVMVHKAARIVQQRSYHYSLRNALFLDPIEHQVYNFTGFSRGVPITRTMGKGLNMRTRAKLLERKLKGFENPVVFSIDASRYDKHLVKDLLKLEHAIYLHCCDDPEFRKLLEWQHTTRGFSEHWTYFLNRGGRVSGDFNTSVGNCIIMLLMLMAYLDKFSKFDIACDGDDSLIFVEKHEEDLFSDFYESFTQFGMNMKLENRSETLEGIIWCQSRPVMVRGKYRMVPSPVKTISHLMSSPKMSPDTPDFNRSYLQAIGLGEFSIFNGVPVLMEFARALIRNTDGAARYTFQDSDPRAYFYRVNEKQYGTAKRREPIVPDLESRLSFERVWGVSVADQLVAEQVLRDWTIDFAAPAEEIIQFDSEERYFGPVTVDGVTA